MKWVSLFGIIIIIIFYMLVGCVGYVVFGDNVLGNLLIGFGFYNFYWLVDFGNVCVVVYLVGVY